MHLKILLPFQIFADEERVLRMIVQTPDGSFGLLPNRRDCVTALTAGVLLYEIDGRGEVYVAVDEGVLVKSGPEVLVSVARAIAGNDLALLHGAVEREFRTRDENERSARTIMAKLEAGFVNRISRLQRD
jgi:F-type H+-transporting ATPase subunit epsilon